jgi:predicted transcriptional regulator
MTDTSVDDDFKQAVRTWVELDRKKAELSKQTSENNKQLAEFGEAIMRYMQQNDIEGCKLPDGGKLLRRQSRRTSAIKINNIKEAVENIVGEAKADAVMLYLVSKRQVSTVEKLRRTRKRGTTTGGGGGDDDDE